MYYSADSISESTAEQAAYRNVLQNRQHIGMYCSTGSTSEFIAEQAAYRMYRRTGSISECTAE